MRFVRVINRDESFFCAVDEGGGVHRLDGDGGPADFLALHAEAGRQGQTTCAYARALIPSAATLPWRLDELDVAPSAERPYLGLPFTPPEVWGAAFTYLRPDETVDDPFVRERQAERPVVFFKATPPRYVGPNDAVGSRSDCTAMIPEPELGIVLDDGGAIIGYTIVNDVSSRDLPRENALYVSYSKIFDRCVSFGPAIVPPEALPNANNLDVRCRVTRGGKLLWDETGNTGRMVRSFAELIEATTAHNKVPVGTLLATGTAMSPPQDMHIVEGDQLEVEISGMGRLRNSVVSV